MLLNFYSFLWRSWRWLCKIICVYKVYNKAVVDIRLHPPCAITSLTLYFWCMLPMAMARSSSGRVTKSQGEGAVLGIFFPTDSALYSIAFATHTKTAEPIEMPFEMMSVLGPSNSVTWGDDPQGVIMGKTCPTSLTPLWIENWTGPCSGVHKIGTDPWLQALGESITSREGGVGLHTAGEVWYLQLPCYMLCIFCYWCMFAFCVGFSFSILSQDIGWEERLRNDLFCIGWT